MKKIVCPIIGQYVTVHLIFQVNSWLVIYFWNSLASTSISLWHAIGINLFVFHRVYLSIRRDVVYNRE